MGTIEMIIVEAIGILATIFLVLGFYMMKEENKLKKGPLQKTEGVVIKYRISETYAPVVEYKVDGETYKKALKYTSIARVSAPWIKIKAESAYDLLDTKLKIRQNSMVSLNTLMQDRFPKGSTLTVYYVPESPEKSYVERFAPTHLEKAFFAGALITLIVMVIIYMVLS